MYKEAFDFMGYIIRTPEWHLTEWRVWDGAALNITQGPQGYQAERDGAYKCMTLYYQSFPVAHANYPFSTPYTAAASAPRRVFGRATPGWLSARDVMLCGSAAAAAIDRRSSTRAPR